MNINYSKEFLFQSINSLSKEELKVLVRFNELGVRLETVKQLGSAITPNDSRDYKNFFNDLVKEMRDEPANPEVGVKEAFNKVIIENWIKEIEDELDSIEHQVNIIYSKIFTALGVDNIIDTINKYYTDIDINAEKVSEDIKNG